MTASLTLTHTHTHTHVRVGFPIVHHCQYCMYGMWKNSDVSMLQSRCLTHPNTILHSFWEFSKLPAKNIRRRNIPRQAVQM